MKRKGFTLIEILMVLVIIIILSFLAIFSYYRAQSKSKLARVSAELTDIAKSLTLYVEDNNDNYPADTARDVPPGLEKYLAGGTWPTSAWPHGVFDWENWVLNNQQVYQITYRLCDTGDPVDTCSDPVLFPHFTRYSGIYNCIFGPCVPQRDHISDIPPPPGYCINCKPKEVNPPL